MRLLKRHLHVAMMVIAVFFNTFSIIYYRCIRTPVGLEPSNIPFPCVHAIHYNTFNYVPFLFGKDMQ